MHDDSAVRVITVCFSSMALVAGIGIGSCATNKRTEDIAPLEDRIKKLEDNLQDNSSKDFSGRWDDREKLRSLDTRLRVLESEQKKESEQEEHEEYQEDFDKQFPPSYFLEQKRKKAQ